MLTPNTRAYQEHIEGKRYLPGPRGMLEELGTMLAATDLTNGLFHANHASNYLPIKAKLPEEKEQTLALINAAINGTVSLKPEHMRAL
jgi:hypothetical protein